MANDTSKDLRDTLARAEAAARAVDHDLPAKTRQEQEAGRNALLSALRSSIVDVGVTELQKRFGRKTLPGPGGLAFNETKGEWIASIYVNTAAKTYMGFEEPLLDFPSDHMIAQIALVE